MTAQTFQIGIKGLIRNANGQILMVHIPAWSGNEPHWDLPGGRIDVGENLLETLKRELQEEIGTPFVGIPRQLMTFLTNITIPAGNVRLPLMFVVYEAKVANPANIRLDPNSAEDDYKWFDPKEAAVKMGYKFPKEFCQLVAKL